jgi:hypothetical protein
MLRRHREWRSTAAEKKTMLLSKKRHMAATVAEQGRGQLGETWKLSGTYPSEHITQPAVLGIWLACANYSAQIRLTGAISTNDVGSWTIRLNDVAQWLFTRE